MTLQLNGWLDTIGWTLVHFVWQGAVIGIVIAAVLAACRDRSSSIACSSCSTTLREASSWSSGKCGRRIKSA